MTGETAYPRSVSLDEASEILGCSTGQIRSLIRERKIGWSKGKRNSFRFFPEHLQQIKEALEVKPRVADPSIEEQIRFIENLSRSPRRKSARRKAAKTTPED